MSDNTSTSSLKSFYNTHLGSNPKNPLTAGFSLLTFAKQFPIQIIKAIALAVLMYAVMNLVLFWISAPWWIILISLIGGLIGMVFLAVTGSLRFISHAFIDTISDLLLGVLEPIDNTYDLWKENSDEKISRKEFTQRVLNEVVVPNVSNNLGKLPFKKRLETLLIKMVERIFKAPEGEVEEPEVEGTEERLERIEDKGTFLKKTISAVEKSANFTKSGIGKPFMLSLVLMVGCWGVLVMLYLWGLV